MPVLKTRSAWFSPRRFFIFQWYKYSHQPIRNVDEWQTDDVLLKRWRLELPIDVEITLKQARSLLKEFDNFQWDYEPCPAFQLSRIITEQLAVIELLTPHGSVYRRNAELALSRWGSSNQRTASRLIGVIGAIVEAYDSGFISSIEELIHADVFKDFLEMAEYLLDRGYHDAAAVLTGSVLEAHLRKLCQKNGLSTRIPVNNKERSKKAEAMNSELTAANAYGMLDQKNVTAWLELRNQAAHGKYDNYKKEQVAVMLKGVRDLLLRLPA